MARLAYFGYTYWENYGLWGLWNHRVLFHWYYKSITQSLKENNNFKSRVFCIKTIQWLYKYISLGSNISIIPQEKWIANTREMISLI